MKHEELERIEALNAARTQELVRVGPLEGTTPEKWAQTVEQFAYISKAHGDADPQFWAVAIESPEQDGDVVTAMTGNGPTSKANAEFYAACHWAVPALLRHIDEQGADIERLREALSGCADTIAKCSTDADAVADDEYSCNCGNPDGGSYASCEYCQRKAYAERLMVQSEAARAALKEDTTRRPVRGADGR